MLTLKQFVPPQRLIKRMESDPVDWQTAYKKAEGRIERLEDYINGIQESLVGHFNWLNRPGALALYGSTYTPTLAEAGLNNINGTPTANESRYLVIDDVVFVTGSASITSIDAAVTTTFTVSLPVASTIAAGDAAGVCNSFYTTCGAGAVTGNTTNVVCNYDVTSVAGAETVTWAFSYRII